MGPAVKCTTPQEPCTETTCRYALPGQRCCLVAIEEHGPMPEAEVGDLMHLTRERVRQIEERALLQVAVAVCRGRLL